MSGGEAAPAWRRGALDVAVALTLGWLFSAGACQVSRLLPLPGSVQIALQALHAWLVLPAASFVALLVALRAVPPERCGSAAVVALYFVLLPLGLLLVGALGALLRTASAGAAL